MWGSGDVRIWGCEDLSINPKILRFDLTIKTPEIKAGEIIPVDTSSCPTCQRLSFSPKSVAASFAPKLESLNTTMTLTGKSFTITEGWPPTPGLHHDPCHANGTCVDAIILPKDATGINAFINAARGSGLTAVWEVTNRVDLFNLVNGNPPVPLSSGGSPGVMLNPGATGPHFHIK